ncbi:MAG: hypothetical protein ACREV4_05745 [Gammaproteobacteria bacterium]
MVKPTVKPLRRSYAWARMIDDDLLAGEYRIRLRGPISVDYLGRTTVQEMAIPGGGRRLVFWAPETLVKLAIPKKIALGAAMVRSLDQVIDAETGRVAGIGAAIVMRREGLDQELYVRLLSGTLDLDSHTPLTGRLRCEVTNAKGENVELDLCFREIGNAC